MLVARHVQEDSDNRWIGTGDFNDVAWSDTTRLFADLSDLKDPRRGRRLLSTFHAGWPLWRYPFVSDGFHLVDLDRVKVLDSDHYAVTATLAVAEQGPREARSLCGGAGGSPGDGRGGCRRRRRGRHQFDAGGLRLRPKK